ncbi:CTLH/CRA C-terminal to lish motif domain-containing protein [Stachybotrys elegans]|uniref:GID complex catalytic subunit 2 n=1 Tax=Stachybotrys elegans TaxID=80388 RepID=A0A8K0WRI3_9HYPO|nr:CTLH/CRA C-terminal to lish motif domain-containing protein [Stachybotrys elegans]
MAGTDDDAPSPFTSLYPEIARMKRSNLRAAIDDIDKIIQSLEHTRAQVAGEGDANWIGMSMMNLQKPVKEGLESVNNDLKEVTKAQKSFGKALDRALPQRELPMEADAMASHEPLISRAIIMHLLREGRFNVASTFLEENQQANSLRTERAALQPSSQLDMDGDDDMNGEGEEGGDIERDILDVKIHSADLQAQFAEMYQILSELKNKNLLPAIQWAYDNSDRLGQKGSNLEFELNKLQFVWLFKGPGVNGLPDDDSNGQQGAMQYARQNFARFQRRHLKEIQQLCCAMVYAPNIEQSPYRQIFETDSTFEEVAGCFTRDFCSLLGLSAESPLYVAVTAGSIALPRLIKYTTYTREKRTEWTTENELAFETPLPSSMIYHPIFVCPVSKEQTTEQNPPMMLTCGHAICRDSLHNIAKNSRYKCPYCPTEGHVKDAVKITL